MDNQDELYLNLCRALDDLKPGTVIPLNDISWVRMRDSMDHHLEGYFCNISNGEYLPYARLAYLIEKEVIKL